MKKLVMICFLLVPLFACSSADPPAPRKSSNPMSPSTGTPARRMNQPQAIPQGQGTPCYAVGFKWGVCTIKSTADGSCDPERDVVIPDECIDRPETQQGIKDGLRQTQMQYQ